MGGKEQETHSEKAKNIKGMRKSKDHLPPKTTYNYNRRDSLGKNKTPPLPPTDACPKNDNNRGPVEFFNKYLRMMKPLREKLRNKYDEGGFSGQLTMDECVNASVEEKRNKIGSEGRDKKSSRHVSSRDDSMTNKKSFGFKSFQSSMRSSPIHSGPLNRRSCPPSTRSSPNHSGVLTGLHSYTSSSALEELQSAVQAAIAHCKNSNSIVPEAQVT